MLLAMEQNLKKIYELNAIKLAYMGDSVFSTLIRKHFILHTDKKNAELNKCVNAIVCAASQAKIMDLVRDSIAGEDVDIMARAKNLHFNNIAKNSSPEQYTKATELEALIGYWYLTSQDDKIDKIINISLENYYDSGRN